jgi:hypothetical protein
VRAGLLHAVFATVLVASLATKQAISDPLLESTSLEQAVIRVAQSQGFAFRGYTTVTDAAIHTLRFDAPGCPGASLVALLAVTLEQEAIVRSDPSFPGARRRYIYLERTWDQPRRFEVFFERAKYAVLSAAGLSRYVPSWHMLLVEAPANCREIDPIDWRLVWDRNYLSTITSNPRTYSGAIE